MADRDAEALKIHARDAVKFAAGSVTLPILYAEIGQPPHPLASGVLLEADQRLFILTGAHIFDGCDLARFYVPAGPIQGSPVALRGSVTRPKNTEHVDVALIELDSRTAQQVSGWKSIKLSAGLSNAPLEGTFVLSGYPSSETFLAGDSFECGLVTAFTERLPQAPTNARNPIDEDDLFFLYAETAIDAEGKLIRAPHLRGASGAVVWQFEEPQEGTSLWRPEHAIRAVAIQSSTMDGEWFRAKSWAYVLDALEQHDAGTAAAVATLAKGASYSS